MSWPSTTMPGMPYGSARRARSSMRGRGPQRAVLAVQVVGDDEHDRRLPDGGHVERLVERADVGGAVAEERERDVGLALHLEGDGRADRDRQPGARRWRWRRCCPCEKSIRCIDPPTPPEPPVERPISSANADLRAPCPGRAPRRGRDRCWSGRRPGCIAAMAPTETASWPWHRCVVPWIWPAMNSSWTFSSKSRIRTIGPVPVEAVGRCARRSSGRAASGCRGRRTGRRVGRGRRAVPFPVSITYRGIRTPNRQPESTRRQPAHAPRRRVLPSLKPLLEQSRSGRRAGRQARGDVADRAADRRHGMTEARRPDVRRKRASMREVAELADVAISSVSRVLSEHPDVSAEMRERVLAAVAAARIRAGLPGPEPAPGGDAVGRLCGRRHLQPAHRDDHVGRRVGPARRPATRCS